MLTSPIHSRQREAALDLEDRAHFLALRMETDMYKEADWDSAPALTEGALNLELSAPGCGLEYWFKAVAQGTLAGLSNGHRPGATTPSWMKSPGPLRSAMVEEMAFRSLAEELATKALCYLVINAPDRSGMEFYLTQAMDEARHSSVFRGHLIELGFGEDELPELIATNAYAQRDSVLVPLERWMLGVARDRKFYIGGVVIFTILVEGILAPAAEISERKWRLLDPAAAQIERGANIDEIRHLTVGAWIIKDHLARSPDDRGPILDLIREGVELWSSLPTDEVVLRRELLFQEGMQQLSDVVGDYELVPGRPLLSTTPQERLEIAQRMTRELQIGRLTYMGLEEAIPFLV